MRILLSLLLLVTITLGQWPADSVYSRAIACNKVTWTPHEANTNSWFYETYGKTCTGADSVYLHCDFKTGTTYQSIAYSYGGEDSDKLFLQKIDNGFLIGSHLCHYESYGDPSDTVAGTDCSGFLSWCWNVPRQSTGMFLNNKAYLHIDRDSLQGGDALVKAGSHAVLVLDTKLPEATLIIESTSAINGVRQRLIDINSTYWQKYTPLRNPAIEGIIPVIATSQPKYKALTLFSNGKVSLSEEADFIALYSVRGQLLSKKNNVKELLLPQRSGFYIVKINIKGRISTFSCIKK